jgi:ABC-type dipeptide/oligopeptide/nickel transport system ATPase subunit
MRDFVVNLTSEPSRSFLAIKAAQSQDIDIDEKSSHIKKISADVDTKFNIGLIVGSSGSGKTTLARQIYDEKFYEKETLDLSKSIMDQFPKSMSYDDISKCLCSIGLTSVPCWIRPAYTLSNGQRFRAEVAIKCANSQDDQEIIIDEWTSVVDRTVAKVMSHSIQKFARKFNKRIVLLSCHYDVIDWLLPDWIIDCNVDRFEDRRSLRQERAERINIEIKECDKATWKNYSKYHYLSANLPGGTIYCYAPYINNEQIGFMCFASYIPGHQTWVHSNRIVLHPDYCGLGIAGKFVDECCEHMKSRGFRVMEKNSSVPRLKYLQKNDRWKLLDSGFMTPSLGKKACQSRKNTLRNYVRWYSWEYLGMKDN